MEIPEDVLKLQNENRELKGKVVELNTKNYNLSSDNSRLERQNERFLKIIENLTESKGE